ncbi:MFS transporter, partial [Halorubrum luteum]
PLGIISVAATFGIVSCFEVVPVIAAQIGGWRPALMISGLPAVGLGLVWLAVGGIGPNHDGTGAPGLGEIRELLVRPEIVILIAAGVSYLFATHSIYGWLAPLLIDRGFEYPTATRLVALLTVGQMVGMMSIPYAADRTSSHSLCIGLCGLVFGGSIVALAFLSNSFYLYAIVAAIAGIAIGGTSPLLRTLPLSMVASGSVSTVIGMIFGIGALGGFVGPVVIGSSLAVTGATIAGFAVLALPGIVLVFVAVAIQ